MVENLILMGGIYHPFEQSSAALAAILGDVDISSTVTMDIEGGLDQIAAGDRYDLLTVNALRWRMTQHEKYIPYRDEWAFSLSPAGQAAIKSHVENGGGLLALHTASICFDDWSEWGNILGGVWEWGRSHHPDHGPIHVNIQAGDHPIVADISDFDIDDEIYHHLSLRPDVTPLLSAEASDGEGLQTIMWARNLGDGRVVYDALGHDAASVRNATHQRILKRSALWALKRSDQELRAI